MTFEVARRTLSLFVRVKLVLSLKLGIRNLKKTSDGVAV